jgi:hypothetical protein
MRSDELLAGPKTGARFASYRRQTPKIKPQIAGLTNVARDELSHLEHADLALAIENRSERVVSVDLSSLRFVLKAVLLDVVPKLLGQLGTGQRCRADDSGELVIRLDRSHEGGIRLAF